MCHSNHHRVALASAVAAAMLLALTVGSTGAGEDPAFDHLKCYQVRDTISNRQVLTADLSPEQNPQFRNENCRIQLPASHFCVDVAKTDVRDRGGDPLPVLDVTGPPAQDYLCYKLRCDKEVVQLEATDQFRDRGITTKRGDFFCAPARKIDPD